MVEFVSRGLRFFSRLFEMFQEGFDIFRGGVYRITRSAEKFLRWLIGGGGEVFRD